MTGKRERCPASGRRTSGCVWTEKVCPVCGKKFFPTYDAGRWKLPEHDRVREET
jgi:hypothetical protein